MIAGDPRYLDRGSGAALEGAGRRITEMAKEIHDWRFREKEAQRDAEETNRRLDIAEVEAKSRLLQQVNRAKTVGARDAERVADKQANVNELQEIGERNVAAAGTRGLSDALGQTGGALGPFGAANPIALAQGGIAAAGMAARMQGKIELAKQMSPEAGRGFLTREREEERWNAVTEGYRREMVTIDDAVADGVLPPEKAKQLSKILQGAIRDRRPPGEVHAQIAKEYDLYDKLVARQQAWADADKDATNLLGAVRQLADAVPKGIDPKTGENLFGDIQKKLAAAKGEWARTQHPSFRSKSDPQESLAALQKILFEMQASAQPDALQTPLQTEVVQQTQQAGPQGAYPAPSLEQAAGMRPPQGPQAAPGAKQAPGGPGTQPAPARRTLAQRRASGKLDREHVARVAMDNAQEALRAGTAEERLGAMKTLLERVGDTMGVDPTSPEVMAIVRETLERAYGKTGRRLAQR